MTLLKGKQIATGADGVSTDNLVDDSVTIDKLNTDVVDDSSLEFDAFGLRIKDAGVKDGYLTESYIKADGTRAFSGNQSMGSNKLTNLSAATVDNDALAYGQSSAVLADLTLDTGSLAVQAGNITVNGYIADYGDDGNGLILGLAGTGANDGSAPQMVSLTTTERGYLQPANGMIIYNETANEMQMYSNGGWATVGTSGSDTGTTNDSWIVNSDVGTGDENASLALYAGDGTSAFQGFWRLNADHVDTDGVPVLEYYVTDDSTIDNSIVSIGQHQATNDGYAQLLLNSGTGAANSAASLKFDAADDVLYIDAADGTGTISAEVNLDATAGLDVSGAALTIDNQAITQTTGGQVTFAGNVDATAGLDVSGAALTINNQAITQTTGGQVTFAGNVDADAGLDVSGAALTIDNQAITQTTGGQVTFAGNVDATAGLDVSSAALTASAALTVTGGAFTFSGSNLDLDPTGTFDLAMDDNQTATIHLDDNLANAFLIQEGSNNYIDINTTNDSEVITFGNTTTNPDLTQLGTGAVTFGGAVTASSGLDVNTQKITNLAPGTLSTDAVNKSQLDAAVITGGSVKAAILHANQLIDGADGYVSGAAAITIQTNPTGGETVTLTDGTTTRSYGATSGGDVQYTIGGSVAVTMQNLADAITGDGSAIWSAVFTTDLDGIDSDGVVIIIEDDASGTIARVYSTGWAAGEIQHVDFLNETDYTSKTLTDLDTSDPGESASNFGVRTNSPDLVDGEIHYDIEGDTLYSWDDNSDAWQTLTGPTGIDYGLTGEITTVNAGDSASAGSQNKAARSDHEHAVATAAAGTIQPDDSAAEGSSTSLARADHTHAIVAAVAVSLAGSNAEGSSTSFSRADHAHARDVENWEDITTQTVTGTDTALSDTLANTPLDVTKVRLYLNGLQQEYGAGNDYTISGTTITWLANTGTAVDMVASDILKAVYISQG